MLTYLSFASRIRLSNRQVGFAPVFLRHSVGLVCCLSWLAVACQGGTPAVDEGDLPKPVSEFEGFVQPSWSFDGSVFTGILSKERALYELSSEGDTPTLLLEDVASGEWLASQLIYAYALELDPEKAWEEGLLNYATGGKTVLSGIENSGGLAWSPDGKQLVTTVISASQAGTEILVMDLDGNETFYSDGLPGDHKGNPTWSPDGKTIYFISSTPQGEYWDPEPVTALHVDENFESEVVEEGSGNSWSARISATFDGWFYVYFSGRESSNKGVCARSLDGAKPACITSGEGTSISAAWSPTERILAAASSGLDHQLILFDPQSERRVVIYENIREACGDYCDDQEPSAPTVGDPAWSADGRQLAYTVSENDKLSIHVIDVQPYLNMLAE
jgi:Tol biopolymer transport system component